MTPVSFESCFGWYHDAAGSCGVIMCSAQGHEDLSTHKNMRLMAEAFASNGYPALRFDYAGTGDSLGDDREAHRVEAWIASVEAAVNWMRTQAQVEHIVLAGLRLGSALAALAADRLANISGLILLSPVVSGRAYMRELSTFSRFIVKPEGSTDTNDAGTLEIAGFAFTPETVEGIRAIDLAAFRKAPAPNVLIMALESHASADKLVKAWGALGCDIQKQAFIHYAEFMLDPAFSRYPAECVEQSLAWLADRFPVGAQKRARPSLAYKPHEDEHFCEHPVFFEPNKNLFGIMCIPEDLAYERPAVIYLNAGANHHIGWGRATVEACRKLAELGFVSLRIDIGAIGDSPDPAAGIDRILYRDESVGDVSAAIDWLERQGFNNITVVGLCAGAHLGFHAAVADPRISQVVMVNLQVFHWRKNTSLAVAFRESYQSTGFYLQRILKMETWQRLARGEIKARGIARTISARLGKKALASLAPIANQFGYSTNDEMRLIKGWMSTLDRRKVQQRFIYSVGDAGLDELSLYRQIKNREVKKAPHVSLSFIENADHNLSQHAARKVLVENLYSMLSAEKTRKTEAVEVTLPRSFAVSTQNS